MKTVKKYSPKTKILSLILSFLIIFYLIPTSVFAEGLDNDITVSDNSVSENAGNNTYTPEIYEVTELREDNVKHFRLPDGSYVAAQYNYPVHYTDENGQLIDIDNRLTESGSELSTGNSRIKFVKKITGNGNIFTLHENNTKITMGLAGAEKKTEGMAINNNNSDDAIESTIGKMVNLENISSTILYEDILDGVDIEYIVHSLNIKENIIVKEKKDSYCYSFTIELNNLTAALADDGNVYISLLDGVRQYIIPAPIVYDANGIYAPDSVAEYSLSTTGNGKYVLIVTVNTAWMNDGTRAFPVIIDPPMLSTGDGTLDFNINNNSPNTNTNGSESFYVSSSERAYLKFNEDYFADIPIGASIMKAELNIIGSSSSDEAAKVGVYAITTPWDSSLTWNKTVTGTPQGSFSTAVLDYVFLNSGNHRQNWNITELYKSWLNGAPNYGVGLKLVDETSNESASFTAYEYCPSEDDINLYEPVIMVTYVYNDGLEDYYPTTTHSAGIGGVGSINLSTGRLTLAIPTLTTTDYLFSFTPTLVYNSSLAGKSATRENVSSAFSTSYMPYGFKLNIQETIVERSYTDADGANRKYYFLYDSDGSTHGFYSKTFTGPYYDNDGLRLTLTKGTNGITIEDVNHNVKTYSSVSGGWHLTSITDNSGNQLIFEFNSSNQPTKVIVKPNGLDDIEMLELIYIGNKLSAVYNDTSKDSVVLRYSGNYLVGTEYYYGDSNTVQQDVWERAQDEEWGRYMYLFSSAAYTYDSIGNITTITDNDANKSLQYEIMNGKITKLSEYAGETLGQQISYTYGTGYTDVRSTGNDEMLNTEDDIITRHVFDDYGRSVSAHSYSALDGNIIGATMKVYADEGKAKNSIKESAIVYDGKATYLSTDEENYDRTLQGGINKTAENGCFKKTVFEEANPEEVIYSNADKEYIISGFGYSNSIIQNGNAKFSLSANVYYYQGEGEEDIVVTHHYDFLDVENTWKFVSGKLDCKIDSTSLTYNKVRKIEIVFNYYGQVNTNGSAPYAMFKDVAFTDYSNLNTYRYKYNVDTGNLVMKTSSGYREYYEYNEQNSVTRVANNKGEIYDYTYLDDGVTLSRELYYTFNRSYSVDGRVMYDYPYGDDNPDSLITKTLVKQTSYIHNNQGLLTSYSYMGSNPSVAGMAYQYYTYETGTGSKIFGALLTEKDSLGHITKYFYDNANGNLLAEINVDSGDGYVYSYDPFGTLESVIPATGTATTHNGITNAESVSYEYDPNTHRLSKVITDSTEYSFSYDSFGNSTGVNAGNNTLATYEYCDNNGKLKKINYGNGFSEEYKYNALELLSEVCYTYSDGTSETAYAYEYNADGTLAKFTNHLDGTTIEYLYDVHGRFVSSSETGASNTNYHNQYEINRYDADGRIEKATEYINYLSSTGWYTVDLINMYSYNANGTLADERIWNTPDDVITYYSYDNFNRVTHTIRRADNFSYRTDYQYVANGYNTSYLVGGYTSTVNGTAKTYNYTYDSKGNITSVVIGDKEIRYVYDDIGQLLREDNGVANKTYVYTYDNAGNIISKKTYSLTAAGVTPTSLTRTDSYTYGNTSWGDLLTAYQGHTITYDSIGNPLSYYNGTSYTLTWEGRRLVGAVKGSKTMSFEYNDEGIRTSKTVNNVKHSYYLNGSQIVAEQWSDKLIVYLYDATGAPMGMMYRTTAYAEEQWDVFWFEKNLQGDIVAVYNSEGTKVVTYTYSDAWGNHTVSYYNGGNSTGVQYNPFRYRGYYYDTDLGMYYLQSRYYDARIGRFINADGYVSTGQGLTGNNMFAYCGNNPVNRVDPNGEGWLGVVVLVVFLVFTLTSCHDSIAEDAAKNATPQDIFNKTDIYPNPNDQELMTVDSLQVVIKIDEYKGLSYDKEKIKEYTELLANNIETEYSSYLGGNTIDRAQLYGEIMLHIIGWDNGIFKKSTDKIELNIYSDGSVKDGRLLLVDLPSKVLGGGYEK